MDAARERAELLLHGVELTLRAAGVGAGVLEQPCDHAQARFGDLAQLALESPAFRVGSLDKSAPRCAHLVHLLPHLSLEVEVRDGDSHRGHHRLGQLGFFEHGRVVHDGRRRITPLTSHEQDGSVALQLRQRHQLPRLVDVCRAGRVPIAEHERGISHRSSEPGT